MNTSSSIRPATLADFEEINQLHAQVWFPQRSKAGWKWLFEDNPAQENVPAGFVSTNSNDEITGFLGSCAIPFILDGLPTKAITGHSYMTSQDHVRHGFQLLKKVLNLNVGLGAYTLNNNELSAPIFPRFGGVNLFGPSAYQSLNWVTNLPLYIKAALSRRKHALNKYMDVRKGEELFTDIHPFNSNQIKKAPGTRILDNFRHHFDELECFWNALILDGGLYADRSPHMLDWRFANPDQTHPPIFITFDNEEGIQAWLIALITKESEIAPPILSIVDLIALPGMDEIALPALITTAIGVAKQMKLMKVCLPHLNDNHRKTLVATPGCHLNTMTFSHAHGRFNPDYDLSKLRKIWYQTPFDGDYSFCLRNLPQTNIQHSQDKLLFSNI